VSFQCSRKEKNTELAQIESPKPGLSRSKVLHLILTGFQPGEQFAHLISQNRFQRFAFRPANPKTVETVRTSKGNLDHPVETG